MKRLILLAFLAFVFPLRAEDSKLSLSNSINHSGMFLYYIIDKSNNTIISPLSVNSTLIMAYMGARGQTAHEMANALHLTLPQNEVAATYHEMISHLGKGVKLGTSLWLNEDTSILSTYKKMVENDFNGVIKKVSFLKPKSTAKEMNNWIYNHSGKKVSQFINPSTISESTKMVLLNTLFLKGQWQSPFPTQKSGMSQFETPSGKIINCKMMNQQSNLYYFENQDTQVVALPIEGLNSNTSFIVFFPKNKHPNLYDFYYEQDESKPEGFISYLSMLEKQDVNLTLPRFIIRQKLNLKSLFRSLGIKAAVDSNANFSGIDGKKDLYISQAFSESTLSIDEGGIFAAASSSAAFSLKSFREIEKPIEMNVNRPFLYAVYNYDTKLLLFLGECLNPSEQANVMTEGEGL